MAKQQAEGARSGNFLHVSILVPTKYETKFEKDVQRFFDEGGFDAARWTLVGAYKTTGPQELASRVTDVHTPGRHLVRSLPEEKGPFTTYVNVWQMPDDDTDGNLGNVMKDLADTDSYVVLDDLVTREVQNLVWRIPMPFPIPAPAEPTSRSRFVRITRRIARDELATYTMNLSYVVPSFMQLGWTFLGCHQNVTGLLNTFFELWELPPAKNAEKLVDDTLARMATSSMFFREVEESTFRETREVLEGAGYFTPRKRAGKMK